MLGYVLFPFIVKRFRESARNIDNIYDALDFAFSFQAFGVYIKPFQVKYEIAKFLEIIAELRPKVVLEIGTAGGGTLFLFTRAADDEAKLISIDLPSGPFGGVTQGGKCSSTSPSLKEGRGSTCYEPTLIIPLRLKRLCRFLETEKSTLSS